MSRNKFAFSFAWIAALLVATPATGQLVGFPVFAVPSGDGDASNTVAAQWNRGLNSDSGENGGFAAYFVRSTEMLSFNVAVGKLIGDVGEFTFGGQASYHLVSAEDATVSLQAGVGYMALSNDALGVPLVGGDLKTLRIPVGLAFEARPSEFGRIWLMPRLDLVRSTNDAGTSTVREFGMSVGASVSSEGGLGIHAAIDFVNVEGGAPLIGAIGLHYVLGN